MQNVLHTRHYNIYKKEHEKYLVQTRSQAKTSSSSLPMVHHIYKGIDPNVRLEKQVIRPVVSSQTHILPETKIYLMLKPRIGHCRPGIKMKMLRFPVFQSYDKPEQTKLLPGRKPIIQIAEGPFFQHLQNVAQSKSRLKFSLKERPIFLGRSEQQDKVVPVLQYTIPKTVPEHDSTPRTITRKDMQDFRRENPVFADPFYRPPPK